MKKASESGMAITEYVLVCLTLSVLAMAVYVAGSSEGSALMVKMAEATEGLLGSITFVVSMP